MYITTRGAVGVLAVLCATATPLALASPTVTGVSGTLSVGQSITVTGSGFGTKAAAAPVLFDDFEAGASGKQVQDQPAAIGKWDDGAGSENVTYTNAVSHTGKMGAAHDFVTTYNASLSKNMTFSRLYMDFWMVVKYNSVKSRNFKPWRFYGDNDNYQLDYVWLCNSNLMDREQANGGVGLGDYGGPDYTNGQWMHIQLEYQESSPGVANGAIHHFINSQVAGLDSNAVLTEGVSAHFNQIRIGHYWDSDAYDPCPGNAGANIYTDDVYIDTSWSRVELGNAASYSGSNHREIQVASSWADGAVQIAKFNPGTFASGSTAYLFVTDSNGNVSAGIPVTIGTSGTVGTPVPVTPDPPANVTVQ